MERISIETKHCARSNHVKTCTACVKFNPCRRKLPGALQPLQLPNGVWQLISMDFHGPLTRDARSPDFRS